MSGSREILLGALLVLLGQIFSIYPQYSIAAFELVLLLVVLCYIPEVLCKTCFGKGNVPCKACGGSGHISPRFPYGGSFRLDTDFRDVDGKICYCIYDYRTKNYGGRGAIILETVISYPMYGLELGRNLTEPRNVEAEVEVLFDKICTEIDKEKLKELKKKMGREVPYGNLSVTNNIKIIDKGELCSSCNGTGKVTCSSCKGRRLRYVI